MAVGGGGGGGTRRPSRKLIDVPQTGTFLDPVLDPLVTPVEDLLSGLLGGLLGQGTPSPGGTGSTNAHGLDHSAEPGDLADRQPGHAADVVAHLGHHRLRFDGGLHRHRRRDGDRLPVGSHLHADDDAHHGPQHDDHHVHGPARRARRRPDQDLGGLL